MGGAPVVRVVEADAAEPMVRRDVGNRIQRRGRSYGIFRGYQRRTAEMDGGSGGREQAAVEQAIEIHVVVVVVVVPRLEFESAAVQIRTLRPGRRAPVLDIALRIRKALDAVGVVALAFGILSGPAILARGAVRVVPFLAAEELIFGTVGPGQDCRGRLANEVVG